MKLTLEINNLKSCNFSKKKLKLIIEKTIKDAQMETLLDRDFLVSIGFVSEEEIKKINKKYRNKNLPTDILSFGNFNSRKELLSHKQNYIFLGELLICPDDIEKYCKKENILFEREFSKVLSHGILHLLGFSHSKKMFSIQENVANEIQKFD